MRRAAGEEGKGFLQVMQGFDFSRALIGLQCIGPAQVSSTETWEYVTHREAFDQRVVDQGIQADLITGLELEAQGIALLFGTEDQVEGMSAFLEKREAKYTGE